MTSLFNEPFVQRFSERKVKLGDKVVKWRSVNEEFLIQKISCAGKSIKSFAQNVSLRPVLQTEVLRGFVSAPENGYVSFSPHTSLRPVIEREISNLFSTATFR